MKNKLIAILGMSACTLALAGCEVNLSTDSSNSDNTENAISATIIDHPLEATEDGVVYATGSYPEIVLSNESAAHYPNLKKTLEVENASWKDSAESVVAEYAGYAIEYPDDMAGTYEDSTTIEIVRADSKLFTILGNSYMESGGAHPSHNTFSINLDVSTGHYLSLSEVVTDTGKLVPVIRDKVYEKYPENKEEIENYIVCCATDDDPFETLMEDEAYTWTLTEDGLHIYFSPYEIASYAAGDMDVVITEDDIPGLIQKAYTISDSSDLESNISTKTAKKKSLEPYYEEYSDYDYYDEEYDNAVAISNPSWHRYVSEDAKPASDEHITLTELTKDKSDWLDTSVWAEKNGFELAFLSYGDGNYYYAPGDGGEYGYEYTTLFLYDYATSELLHTYDLSILCNGPDDEEGNESCTSQYIHWAQAMDGVLYVALGHNGYASEEPWSSYMVAIDMSTETVLWRSEPLVSNASNFKIVDDTIICGYGFTDEPDYLYLLDKNNGEKIEEIKLESAPEQMEIVDDTLYIATYDTAYTFKINR